LAFGFMSAAKRIVAFAAGLIVVALFLGWPLIEGVANRAIRFVDGQHFLGGGPIQARSKETLPSVSVESGRTLCCRMSYCDFRFPLPPGTRVASIDPVTGGFDTIKGVIYLTNANGGTVDLRAYARAMRRDGFSVGGDAYLGLTASSPDGGFVAAENSGRTCMLSFSFFGDY
jgi:hypothetical protein